MIVSAILGNLRLVGIGLAVAGAAAVGLYIHSLRGAVADLEERNAVLQANLETALGAAAANEAAYDAEKQAHARTAVALEQASARAVARARKITALEEAARHAPPTDDAPVAPVLRAVLDGLRRTPGAEGGDADPR